MTVVGLGVLLGRGWKGRGRKNLSRAAYNEEPVISNTIELIEIINLQRTYHSKIGDEGIFYPNPLDVSRLLPRRGAYLIRWRDPEEAHQANPALF